MRILVKIQQTLFFQSAPKRAPDARPLVLTVDPSASQLLLFLRADLAPASLLAECCTLHELCWCCCSDTCRTCTKLGGGGGDTFPDGAPPLAAAPNIT